jgi:hypothetical protein
LRDRNRSLFLSTFVFSWTGKHGKKWPVPLSALPLCALTAHMLEQQRAQLCGALWTTANKRVIMTQYD